MIMLDYKNIKQLKNLFPDKIETAWLFGSYTKNPITANDIDIALKISKGSTFSKKDINQLKIMNDNNCHIYINCYTDPSRKQFKIGSNKPYHFVILTEADFSSYFFNRNRGSLKKLF